LRPFYRTEVSLSAISTGEQARFAIAPRMVTDSLYALRSAAVMGVGAAIGSAWLVGEDIAQGRLVHLAPQWRAAPLPVWLVYPQARFHPARLRRFLDVMRAGTIAAFSPQQRLG
jgi:DNA-binding transcriptional LysR family regulator